MGFFDDLSRKATETYKNTAEKTNKITRELKLKSLMNENKGKIEKIYADIGKKVYEKHVREENIDIKSELMEECLKIDALAKEIEDIRTEMLELKDLRICKKCGAEVAIEAKFCSKCGCVQETPTKNNEVTANTPSEVVENTECNNSEENSVTNNNEGNNA